VKRQACLQALLERFGCPAVSLSEPFEDGLALLRVAEGRGLEGVVSKRRDASYRYGGDQMEACACLDCGSGFGAKCKWEKLLLWVLVVRKRTHPGSATVVRWRSVAGLLYHHIAVVVAAVPKMPALCRLCCKSPSWTSDTQMLSIHLKWDFLRRRPEECDSSKKANQNQDSILSGTPNLKEGQL